MISTEITFYEFIILITIKEMFLEKIFTKVYMQITTQYPNKRLDKQIHVIQFQWS